MRVLRSYCARSAHLLNRGCDMRCTWRRWRATSEPEGVVVVGSCGCGRCLPQRRRTLVLPCDHVREIRAAAAGRLRLLRRRIA